MCRRYYYDFGWLKNVLYIRLNLLDLELFGEISGLRLNSKKTEILWIGACAGRQDKLCPEKDLKWVTDKLKA